MPESISLVRQCVQYRDVIEHDSGGLLSIISVVLSSTVPLACAISTL